MLPGLQNKRAIVTGGASGIGLAICKALACRVSKWQWLTLTWRQQQAQQVKFEMREPFP